MTRIRHVGAIASRRSQRISSHPPVQDLQPVKRVAGLLAHPGGERLMARQERRVIATRRQPLGLRLG